MRVATRRTARRLMWWTVVTNGVILLLWLWAMLWLAVPRHDICFAINPTGAGCAVVGRGPAAMGAAIAMVGVFAAAAWISARAAQIVWLPWILIAGYTILALVLYRVVLYA